MKEKGKSLSSILALKLHAVYDIIPISDNEYHWHGIIQGTFYQLEDACCLGAYSNLRIS